MDYNALDILVLLPRLYCFQFAQPLTLNKCTLVLVAILQRQKIRKEKLKGHKKQTLWRSGNTWDARTPLTVVFSHIV